MDKELLIMVLQFSSILLLIPHLLLSLLGLLEEKKSGRDGLVIMLNGLTTRPPWPTREFLTILLCSSFNLKKDQLPLLLQPGM